MYQLKCYITVCRYMSFTKAANQLLITQQGISKIISRMEEELDVPLFVRQNMKLELTDYGKLFLNSAIGILREYNSVTEQLAQMREQNVASLNIYLPTGMMHVFTLDAFSRFRDSYPEINLNLQQASDIECENALVSGKADVAFCAMPVDTNVFTVHATKSQPVYFLVSRKNPLSRCRTINVSQLRDEQFITIDADNKCGDGFVSRCEQAGYTPKVYMRTADTHLIGELCRENAGISFYIGEPVDIPEGVAVIPEDPMNTWDVGIVTLAYRKPSKLAEEFISFFKNW
ncbi:MAG: LysR family transcriptional regulator [Oscillospiraceae bacterium]|jgi:DNA-binding transcriptional LysR family regulator